MIIVLVLSVSSILWNLKKKKNVFSDQQLFWELWSWSLLLFFPPPLWRLHSGDLPVGQTVVSTKEKTLTQYVPPRGETRRKFLLERQSDVLRVNRLSDAHNHDVVNGDEVRPSGVVYWLVPPSGSRTGKDWLHPEEIPVRNETSRDNSTTSVKL